MKIFFLRCICSLAVLAPLWNARADAFLFDMGTDTSPVEAGFTGVTATNLFAGNAAFGWQNKSGLKAYDRAYMAPLANHRNSEEQPPMWTNPITEDFVTATNANTFLLKAPPGIYTVYIVCGASEFFRAEFFDFTVKIGDQEQRVQIAGNYQYRTLRFQAAVANEPLAIHFMPRSRWLVNAIMAWTPNEAQRIETEVIKPFEAWTFFLPPQELAKWKLEPEPATGPLPAIPETDRQRGFTVYSKHYLECVYPHTNPRPEELSPELRLFATPSEYEPCNFVILPWRDLENAKVTVSDLGPVPAANIDIRHVRFLRARPNYTVLHRYRVVPDVLEHFDTLNLPANENARFWLTLHIPESAPAGLYHGQVTFACDQGKVVLPIQLRILPIHLREDPDKLFGIYYQHPYDSISSSSDDVSKAYFQRKAELEHADMVAHGTRNVVLSLWCSPADAQGKFTINWDAFAAKLDLWKKHDFKGPIVVGFNTEGIYEKYMKERYGEHLHGIKAPPKAFSDEITALTKAIEAERVKRGWPEFLYYPVDEPSTEPDAVQFMATVMKACRAAHVRTYITADPTFDQFQPLKPFIDVWCTQPFAPDRETVLADSQARHVEYWCYPNHVNGENDHTPVTGARMTYGFGFWRSGFRTLIPWIYSYNIGDPFNYLDGSSMDFFNRSEPDGTPMPVVMWEAYREGYDDYRYIYTLEQLIAEAEKGGSKKAKQAAQTAKAELQSIWDAIHVQTKYMYNGLWSPSEFDVYRWMIARQILALQSALPSSHR